MASIIALLLMLTSLAGLYIMLTRKNKRLVTVAFISTLIIGGIILWVGTLLNVPPSNMVSFLSIFLINAGTFAILCLGLNIQWGYTGLFNIGVAGFFGVGAYVSTILVQDPTLMSVGEGLEGFSANYFNMPFWVGLLGAMAVSGIIAIIVGFATLRLRTDYLAIATIGISEILRLIVSNEPGLTEGTRGIPNIPQPFNQCIVNNPNAPKPPCEFFGFEFPQFLHPAAYNWFYLVLILAIILIIFIALERVSRSPWGRTLRAIREDEDAAQSLGKNNFAFKMQSLIMGAIIMGAAGSLYAHFIKFVSPEIFDPVQRTFLVWVMLIVGGTGNNRGAILGAFVMWGVWVSTSFLANVIPPTIHAPFGDIDVAAQLFGPLRVMAIVVILELILLYRPRGLLGEEKHTSTMHTPKP